MAALLTCHYTRLVDQLTLTNASKGGMIMGFKGNLSPDPSNQDGANFLPDDMRNVLPIASSTDSEGEEEISYEGYEVLPQDFSENNIQSNTNPDESQESSSEDENDFDVNQPNSGERSAFDESTKTELKELWNSANNNRLTDIVIDSVKEEQIKSAMAGFKLPLTSIPQWAQQVPEEEWKEQLINRVNVLNKVTEV